MSSDCRKGDSHIATSLVLSSDLEALQGPDAFEAFSFSGIAAVVRVVGRNARSDTVTLIEPRRSDVTSALSTKNSAANVHGTCETGGRQRSFISI